MIGDNVDEKIAALSRSENEYGVDPFGFSLDYSLSAVAPFIWLFKHYHRVETFGIEKVPREVPSLAELWWTRSRRERWSQ